MTTSTPWADTVAALDAPRAESYRITYRPPALELAAWRRVRALRLRAVARLVLWALVGFGLAFAAFTASAQSSTCYWSITYGGGGGSGTIGAPDGSGVEGFCTAKRAEWTAGGGTFTEDYCRALGDTGAEYALTYEGVYYTATATSQASCFDAGPDPEPPPVLSVEDAVQLSWLVVLCWAGAWGIRVLGRALVAGGGSTGAGPDDTA